MECQAVAEGVSPASDVLPVSEEFSSESETLSLAEEVSSSAPEDSSTVEETELSVAEEEGSSASPQEVRLKIMIADKRIGKIFFTGFSSFR